MKNNTHVLSLSIAATRSNDPVAYVSTPIYICVVWENLLDEVVAEV